jgi:hypothetical protein
MAGAGGIFVMIIGAVLGAFAAAGAAALLIWGMRQGQPKWQRALAVGLILLSSTAQLLMAPAWTVLLSGHGSHGESIAWSDFPFFLYVFLVAPPVTIIALIVRLVRTKRQL